MTIQLYGIPNCDTVKRARAWLLEHHAAFDFHDFKKTGVPAESLPLWMAALGRDALINRKGTTWRGLDDTLRALAEADTTALDLIKAQPSVVKRPVAQWPNGRVTVGFDATRWATYLPAGPR
jgi:arsenate reductase (glutaredoxin)